MDQMLVQMLDSFNYPYWHDDALCRSSSYDMNWWFPSSPKERKLAVLVCNECPVKQKCLDWIRDIEKEERRAVPGIYGGLTEDQRRKTKQCSIKECSTLVPSKYQDFCSEEHKKRYHYLTSDKFKHKRYGQ